MKDGPEFERVLDLVDVDSDKWRQYASKASWPLSWVYRREGRTLLRYEREAVLRFDAAILVSQAESDLFRSLAPECSDRITFMENGVDSEFFSPEREYPDPYNGNRSVLVFTGAMDYRANVDAVCWFVKEVFPAVHDRHPACRLFIVGSRPTAAVRNLGLEEGVTVTGWVDDVRPFLAHARAAVAPLRLARYSRPGDKVLLSNENTAAEAEIRSLVAVGDLRSHMMELRLTPRTNNWLIGEAVTVQLPASSREQATTVDRDAVVLRDRGNYVYVIGEDSTARRVDVELGSGSGKRIAVIGALMPGDQVVVRGAETLRDGQKVSPLAGSVSMR